MLGRPLTPGDNERFAGRPVIVLLKVGNGRFHYVVVVGTTGTHIVVHDPAARVSMRKPEQVDEARARDDSIVIDAPEAL